MINEEDLKEFGILEEFSGIHAKLQIKKKEVSDKASRLLSKFNVADLTIEDPAIEDIVREIFSNV